VVQSALTVAIAIDDPELAERVRDILAGRRGCEVVAEDDGRKAAVLITDTPGDWADEPLEAAVLMLTEVSTTADALRMGATAVLPVDVGARALLAAVHAAAAGLTVMPTQYLHALGGPASGGTESEDDAGTSLTARELQVLQLLAEGASNKAIARRLGISPHTAKFHVATIAGKLGASGRTDAVAKAMRLGLVMV